MANMYFLTVALVIAGWLMVLVGLRRGLERRGAELRLEFQRQIRFAV